MRTSNTKQSRFTLNASLFTLLLLCGLAPDLQATTGTNKQFAGTTDYWTNNTVWTGANYPGFVGAETAFLVTNAVGSYTNILDATLPNNPLLISMSNLNGSVTLIVTNTTLKSQLKIGTGGRLLLDNLATQTVQTSISLNGLDPRITINNGATLITTVVPALFTGISGTTALVIRATSGGDGSTWDVNGGQITIGNTSSTGNVLTINGGGSVGGLAVTNVGKLYVGELGAVSNRLNLINGVRFIIPGSGSGAETVISRVGPAINSDNSMTVDDSAFLSGSYICVGVGDVAAGGPGGRRNSLVVTNGGLVSAVIMYVGQSAASAGCSNNTVMVVGTNSSGIRSTINLNANILKIGTEATAVSNRVVVDYGMITNVSAVSIGGGGAGANYNMLIVTNGGLVSVSGAVTMGGASGTTGNTLRIDGAAMTNLSLRAYTNNSAIFTAGTLAMGSATCDDSPVFNVGDGTQVATLIALDAGGTFDFYTGMRINSNATLRGACTVRSRAVGSAALTVTNGAILTPGLTGPALVTVNSNMVWSGGGEFQCDITDVAGGIGVGWDSLSMAGSLTVADAGAKKLRIALNSMGTDTANFDPTKNYSFKIASCGSVPTFDASDFQISTNNFLPVTDGAWSVSTLEGSLYLVYTASGSAQPAANYAWNVPNNGLWSTAGNWEGVVAPDALGDSAWNLTFGGNATPYVSTNDLSGNFELSNLVFNSSTPSVTNLIVGTNLSFSGTGGGIQQWGSGTFRVSNSITLVEDMTFSGPGLGAVILHTNVSGVGGITKLDSGKLVLQGSNTFTGPVLVNGNGMLRADHAKALGRGSVTVSNGTLFVNSGTATALELGQTGYNGLTGLVTGSGSVWTNNAIFKLGTNSSFNTLTIANTGRMTHAAAVVIGENGPSNTAVVRDGGLWNLGGKALTVGNAALATGNVLRVDDGGVVTNIHTLYVGNTGGQLNSLMITNGGKVFCSVLEQAHAIGYGSSNNYAIVEGSNSVGPATLTFANSALYVGNGTGGGAATRDNWLRVGAGGYIESTKYGLRVGYNAAGGNFVIVTNGGLLKTAGDVLIPTIGYASSNNYLIVSGANGDQPSTWNNGANPLEIGSGLAAGGGRATGCGWRAAGWRPISVR